jgi:hypothetical protein
MEEPAEASNCFFDDSVGGEVDAAGGYAVTQAGTPAVWALLLPVCCRVTDGGETCMFQLPLRNHLKSRWFPRWFPRWLNEVGGWFPGNVRWFAKMAGWFPLGGSGRLATKEVALDLPRQVATESNKS